MNGQNRSLSSLLARERATWQGFGREPIEHSQVEAAPLRQALLRPMSASATAGIALASLMGAFPGETEASIMAELEALAADREIFRIGDCWRLPATVAELIARGRARAARKAPPGTAIEAVLGALTNEAQSAEAIAKRAGVSPATAEDALRAIHAHGAAEHPLELYAFCDLAGKYVLGWQQASEAGAEGGK